MKLKKRIVIIMICLLILTIIAPELYIRYTEYTLKKELKVAIKDYANTYCNKEVEVKRIEISYSWNTAHWKTELVPEINYISGGTDEGKVRLNNSPCTEHEGFILHREKQRFIKYYNLLDPPDFGEGNLFNSYRHPAYTGLYYLSVLVLLIPIIFLLIIYIKLNQKEKREKE